jgi:hypothetical protein
MPQLSLYKKSCRIAILSLIALSGVSAQSQSTPAQDTSQAPASEAASAPVVVGNLSSKDLAPKTVEDWSTPSLKGSQLVFGDTLVAEVYKNNPAYTREFIATQWRVADPIDLYVIKPTGVEKPPVILYLYSYPFELDHFRDDAFCQFLVRNGVAAVGFPSALTGLRYHAPRPMKQWFVSELQESMATSAHDVQMILDYLDKRGDLDMSRVGMFGDGSGASIAILAAAVDPRIKSLDLLDPWGDWPDWIAKSTLVPENERPDYLKPEWLARVAPLDPVKWLPTLKDRNVRIQFVSSVTVPPDEATKKVEAAAPSNAKIIHYADAKAFKIANASGTGFDWIKEQVAGKSPKADGDLHSQNPLARRSEQ